MDSRTYWKNREEEQRKRPNISNIRALDSIWLIRIKFLVENVL